MVLVAHSTSRIPRGGLPSVGSARRAVSTPASGRDLPSRFGFRSGDRRTHGSRSILLGDVRQLFAATSEHTGYDEYRVAIMEENVLGKGTASARFWGWKKLRELYGLHSRLAVFRCFRTLWESDPEGRPLLAVLCACARDPLLRISAATILKAPQGSVVTPDDLLGAIAEVAPDRFSPTNPHICTLHDVGREGKSVAAC